MNQTNRVDLAVQRSARLVSEALDLLDAHGGPPEAAAHLDLALGVLTRELAQPKDQS